MAVQRFRSQFRGFHREDVVNYIEFLNQQHNSQLEQLNTQLMNAQQPKVDPLEIVELQAQLDAALERCAQLEKQLAEQKVTTADLELAAYRRAERAERQAKERAQQIYDRANGALAEASLLAESAMEQMKGYQDSIESTVDAFRNAAAALYAAKPQDDE